MPELDRLVPDVESELDLRKLANARLVRRAATFVATSLGAVILSRYSDQLVHSARVLAASEAGFQVPEGSLFEFGASLVALAFLLHLLFALATMIWQWRTFVPMLESKIPEEVAVSLVRLTSIFATSQRTAQSRQVIGAASVVVGIVKLAQGWPGDPRPIDSALIPLTLIGIGGTIMFVSFWLRYGFPYSRTVLIPLLEAVVGAEETKLDQLSIDRKVSEIVSRVRKQKPWWFIRPTWFL